MENLPKLFKPLRLPLGIALYYPTTTRSTIMTIVFALITYANFWAVSQSTEFNFYNIYKFAPGFILGLIAYDAASLSLGDYPSWWKEEFFLHSYLKKFFKSMIERKMRK